MSSDFEAEDGELPESPVHRNDNYDSINMEIESTDEGNEVDDEAEQLRKILLDQLKQKRLAKHTETPQKRKTPEKQTPPKQQTVRMIPPLRPPLSPPGFSSSSNFMLGEFLDEFPPPPLPPTSLSTLDDTNFFYNDLVCTDSIVDAGDLADTPMSPENPLDLSQWLESSEDELSGDEPVYDIDLESVKKDSRGRKKEIDRLFRKQKANELQYQNTKSAVERAKKELNELEQKLLQHAEKGIELNERIKTHVDKYFSIDSDRIGKISVEREKWKSKLNQRSARSKERIRNLRENASLLMAQPYVRPKIIPLNPISTPPPTFLSSNYVNETPKILDYKTPEKNTKSEKSNKLEKSSSKPTRSNSQPTRKRSKDESKKVKRKDSKSNRKSVDKSLEKLADQLNIAQIIGDGKSNVEAEAELFTRMLERSKKKQTSNESTEKPMEEPKKDAVKQDEEHVEDPIHPEVVPSTSFLPPPFPSHLKPEFTFPSTSIYGSLQDAAKNPLIRLQSYRISPAFPFEHIDHPSVSNRINLSVPLCPFELHGICADPTCQWQHDKDFRMSDQEIIKQILSVWPSLLPPNVTADELSKKLLEMNSVDYVSRMLCSAIPLQVREQCFSDELKKFINNQLEDK